MLLESEPEAAKVVSPKRAFRDLKQDGSRAMLVIVKQTAPLPDIAAPTLNARRPTLRRTRR
jgi:hypothetical protein